VGITEASTSASAVHPRRGVHSQVARAVIILWMITVVTTAWAQPRTPPIVDPGRYMCPEATLPLRIAAVQVNDAATLDPLAWMTLLGLDVTDPVLVPNRRGAAIYIYVLAYRSRSPVEIEVSVTPFGATEPTLRQTVLPEPPRLPGGFHFHASYVVVEVDRSAYATTFPVDGPYRLEARPARAPESAYVDGFCASETTSWALVLRR